ncbi:MAG: TIGR00268 family protein [Deltaproteobacteria bacterium RBG_13_43_22]|nr:MAG: TIGR00268 family protein [Deltaproteobacteria bacterium RBG_13_43_22]
MPSSKTKKLINTLKQFQPGAVAFSGGVDSTLLLYLAREAWSDPPLAFSFVSPLLTARERDRIEKLGGFLKARLYWLKTKEYLDLRFKKNTPSRCYYCKKSRLTQARPFLNQMGIQFLLDGTNADDLKTHRPGIRASMEAKVISPFALFNWTKTEIREVSRGFGLPTWNQPSSPCMATRVAYGQPITLPLLKRLARGEEVLHQMGFGECRLRVHNSLVRIEIPEKEFHRIFDRQRKNDLLSRLSALGFTYITLDLKGFRSGSMDEGLKKQKRIVLPEERPLRGT